MATQKAVIEVDIQGTEKVESMRTQMRKLREQLAQLPEGTAEFTQVQKQLGELKDKMDDLGKSVNTMSGGPLERLNNSFSMIGTSIMSLDFDNALTGINGMSAALGDIKGKDIVAIFKNFGSALANLGQALLSNPIFLIAGTIALIATNMDKVFKIFPSFEKALKGIGDEERAIAKAVEARAAASKKAYDQSALEVNQLKLAGKTEREILEYRMSRVKSSIEDAKVQLETSVNQAKMQIDTAKRNKEILNGILMFINAPMTIILDMIDRIGQVVGKDFGLNKKFADLMSSFVVDPVQIEEDLNKSIVAQQDALKQMESDYAGFQNEVKDIDKKAADDRKKANDKKNEDAEKENDKKKEAAKKAQDEMDALQEKWYQEDLEKAKKQQDLINQIKREALDEEEALAQEIENLRQGAKATELQNVQDEYFAKIAAAEKLGLDSIVLEKELARKKGEINDKYRKEEKQKEKELQDAKYGIAKASIDSMMSLNDLLTTTGVLNAEQSFKVGKALSIAQTTISTIQGVQNALSAQTTIPEPFGSALKIANAIAIGTAGAANIAKIAATKFNAKGGGGSSGGGATTPSGGGGGGMGAGSTNAPALDLSFVNNQTNKPQPLQTYVLATNVSNAQEAEEKIKDQSRIIK